jgi:alkylation response protein AidB-like acyl-CoA dehydrogenase
MNAGLDSETLQLTVSAIGQFCQRELPDEKLLELDEKDEFPVDLIREMCGSLGIQLLFIPEQYGGMGGGAWDVYRVCE